MEFTLPNHYVFHYVNCWEDVNEKNQKIIVLYGCCQFDVNIALEKEHPFFEDENFRIKLARMEFNLVTGEADFKIVCDHLSLEFPVINQKLIGYKNRYAYISYLFQTLPQDKVGQKNLYFQGFIKFDLQEHKVVKKLNFGETKTAGEVFYAPKDPIPGQERDEDDGYCMSFVYDWKTEKTEFRMWDAKTMDETPVLRAETNKRVPNGFHTFFVNDQDLD